MINKILSRAFIVSNQKFSVNFQNAMTTKVGEFYFTSFKETKANNEKMDNLRICFRTMNARDAVDPVEYGLLVKDNTVHISNNQMNARDIYYIYEPDKNLFVVFNHLLLAKEILQACELELTYSSIKIYENGSHFKHIKQMTHGESITCIAKGTTVELTAKTERDILEDIAADDSYTLEDAKQKFYDKLLEATDRLTKNSKEISIPLSGGLDSGTVAYLLTQLNKDISAYSIGTEWGNEYEAAESTADFIGIGLKRVFLTREELLSEIPYIVAAYAFNVANNVEISLVPQCLYRKITAESPNKDILFATGFGSDLLNAGIFKPFDTYDELRNEIITTLKKTRMPNETYSNLFFQNNSMYQNISVVHPFWETSVIEESLRIPAKYKVAEGRDKYFFRQLMEDKMGYDNCWRKKQAVHTGTGIGANLMQAIGNGDSSFGKEEYEGYIRNLHEQIFAKNDFSILNK